MKPPEGTVFFLDRSLGIDPTRTELVKSGLAVSESLTLRPPRAPSRQAQPARTTYEPGASKIPPPEIASTQIRSRSHGSTTGFSDPTPEKALS